MQPSTYGLDSRWQDEGGSCAAPQNTQHDVVGGSFLSPATATPVQLDRTLELLISSQTRRDHLSLVYIRVLEVIKFAQQLNPRRPARVGCVSMLHAQGTYVGSHRRPGAVT